MLTVLLNVAVAVVVAVVAAVVAAVAVVHLLVAAEVRIPEAEGFAAAVEFMLRQWADQGISEAEFATTEEEAFATTEELVEAMPSNVRQSIVRLPYRIPIQAEFDRESREFPTGEILSSVAVEEFHEQSLETGLVLEISVSMEETMITSESPGRVFQIACPGSEIDLTTEIRSASTTDSLASATISTGHRTTDMPAITATGMAIEDTELDRDSLMDLVQALDTALVQIWDTTGGLAAEMVTALVADPDATAASVIVRWAGA